MNGIGGLLTFTSEKRTPIISIMKYIILIPIEIYPDILLLPILGLPVIVSKASENKK